MAIKYSFGVCIHIKRTQKYTHAHTKKSTTVNKKMRIQTEHNLYNLTTLYIQLIHLLMMKYVENALIRKFVRCSDNMHHNI